MCIFCDFTVTDYNRGGKDIKMKAIDYGPQIKWAREQKLLTLPLFAREMGGKLGISNNPMKRWKRSSIFCASVSMTYLECAITLYSFNNSKVFTNEEIEELRGSPAHQCGSTLLI